MQPAVRDPQASIALGSCRLLYTDHKIFRTREPNHSLVFHVFQTLQRGDALEDMLFNRCIHAR
jgi:hypothetical protein